jgi:uncharacterized protein (TIGR00251 family)
MPTPWQLRDNQLLLDCHVQPGARQTRISGIHGNRLKIQLNAPPVDGKANKQLIDFLSKQFGKPKSQVVLVRGQTSRTKTIRIDSINRLPDWLAQYDEPE